MRSGTGNMDLIILYFTENQSSFNKIGGVLEESGLNVELRRVELFPDIFDSLEALVPDLIITEHTLPSSAPLELLDFLREKALHVPYVLIADTISEAYAMDIFMKGAEDYVLSNRLGRLRLVIGQILEKRRREKRFRAIIEQGADVVLVIDRNKKISYSTPTVKRVLGYSEAEAEWLQREQLIYQEDLDLFASRLRQSSEQPGAPIGPFEIRLVDKRKRRRWFHATLNNLLHTPEVAGTVLVLHDIGLQKDAEYRMLQSTLALESERKRFYDLFSQAPSGMGILRGKNHVFEMANPLYLQLIGKQDVIGMPLSEALPSLADQGFIAMLDGVYKTGKTSTGREMKATVYHEATDSPKDIYISFVFQPYRNASGGIEGIFFFINDVTEAVLARQRIEESERRYKQIVETAQEGIWLINEKGMTLFVNRKLCEILGYEESELMGKHYATFLSRGYKESQFLDWERKEKEQIDMQFISKRGTSVWTTVSSNAVYDDHGKYKGTTAMLSDITEKKKLEDLLHKATTLARIGSFEIDMFNYKLFWSDITKEIHEVDADFTGDFETGVGFIKEGFSRDLVNNSFFETYTKGTPTDLEVQLITAKGNERWVRIIAEAEFIHGECSKMFGSLQDIDAQKSVEIELLKTVEEKENILESIGDGFFAVDHDWKVTYWNRNAEILAQVKRERIIGQKFWEVLPELVELPLHDIYRKAMATKTVQHVEAFYEKTNRWYDNTVYPSPTGLSIYFRDITERKESALKVMQLNNDLRQYTKELIVSNKELEQFSYIISHNLRAPVANIKGLLEALKDDSNPAEIQEMLRHSLYSSVQVLDDVINDLNSILKIKNELKEKKKVVSFEELVNKIRLSILNVVEEENVVFRTDFSEAPELFTLKTYIHSILYNLIVNSIKYRQPGHSPVIHISTRKKDDKIELLFSDNGMGIDLKQRSGQVFGLYKRFHSHKEGKGLGLFMVKTQVETLGGTIAIKSEVNSGTEFRIAFPLRK